MNTSATGGRGAWEQASADRGGRSQKKKEGGMLECEDENVETKK